MKLEKYEVSRMDCLVVLRVLEFGLICIWLVGFYISLQ